MKNRSVAMGATVCLLLWMQGTSFAQEAGGKVFVLKGGIDVMGESETDFKGFLGMDTETGDVKTGISFSAEGLLNMQGFMVGLGAAYMVPRGIDEDWPDGKFSRLPLYAVLNVPFKSGDITPFIAAHAGYSFFFMDSEMKDFWKDATGGTASTEGGFYWALGGGIILSNNIQFEVLYQSQRASTTLKAGGASETFKTEYTHVTLSIGYRFL
jgi:hypothetical protein